MTDLFNGTFKDDDLIKKYKKNFTLDCLNYDYIPTSLPKAKRIIAIGDIHGDLLLAKKLLMLAKVIDDDFNWIAEPKETIVVQVGDQIDRCRPYKKKCDDPEATIDDENSDVKILQLFTLLHQKAKKYGGAVYSLLGNHEIMNVEGNFNYVSYKGIKEFENYIDPENPNIKFKDGTEARKYAFKKGKHYARFLACTRVAALVIGSFIFVHAGITPTLIKKYKLTKKKELPTINELVRRWLLDKLIDSNIDDIISSEKISPFWPRLLGSIPPDVDMKNDICSKYVEPILSIYDLKGMIIGHTPQIYTNSEGINSTCDKSLWRIDIGASKAFNVFDTIKPVKKKLQVLEILNDSEIKIIS